MTRVPAIVVLLILGIFSLPVAAFFLDGEGTENWIVPAQLVVMAALGVAFAWVLPLAPRDSSAARRTLVGAACGIGTAVVGVVVFWLLLNGIRGA